jgi:endonuclease/exonuclease/phosphatase family metal-dependent hydrolase
VAGLVALVIVNQNLKPEASRTVPTAVATLPSVLPSSIEVASWNLGYAGLGAESDFVADGGTSFLPPSRDVVERNLEGIIRTLGTITSDVKLLQEVPGSGLLTYWVPVRERVQSALAADQVNYRQDVATWGIPWPLALDHGTLLASRANAASVEVVPLPGEPKPMMSFVRRRYALQVARFPIEDGGNWVIANLHLSAFDDGGKVRAEQLAAVMAFATTEYEAGNHVILGGDWNMVLADPKLPSNTDKKFLFWIVDFPAAVLPPGWSIATDTKLPTVRTLYKPYVAGENFVTSIDGFIVSPNVAVESVHAIDTLFANSDHMPVIARFRAAGQ